MNKQKLAPQYTELPTKDIVKGIVNNPNNQDLVDYLTFLAEELKKTESLKLIGGNSCWLNSEVYHYNFIFEDLLLKDLPENFRTNFGIFSEVRQRQNHRASELVGFVYSFTDNEQFDLQFQDSEDYKYITISFSIS